MSSTNYSTAVMLFNPNIRAIAVSYDPGEYKKNKQTYPFKTLDQTIKVGDMVVIPTHTRHGFTVVKVEEVDVEVDFESSVQLEWISDRVNTPAFDEIVKQENEWISEMKKAQVRKKREDLKNSMMEMYEADGITKAAIVNMGSVPVIEAQPVEAEEETE